MNKVKIVKKRGVLGGQPTIEGTRIGVYHIASFLANDMSITDIKNAYPHLTDQQIEAAFLYLEQRARKERAKLEPQTS